MDLGFRVLMTVMVILIFQLLADSHHYEIKVDDHDANDTIFAGIITDEDGDKRVENLDAGNLYSALPIDAEGCFNQTQPEIEITQPLPITVWKDNARYSDTVDISCYGADDGEIHLDMTGGRTNMYTNTFAWTGPGGLVQNDSIQTGLEPGLYTVTVTDTEGCEGDSSFMLIEPTQITMRC